MTGAATRSGKRRGAKPTFVAEQLAVLLELRAKGLTQRQIARTLGTSQATVFRTLQRGMA